MSDFTKANKDAFDKFAATYDAESWQLQIARILTESLQKNKDWIGAQWSGNDGRQVKLLDYACGTGAATVALQPFVTTTRGMDLSEGMIKRYNEAMSKLSLSPDQAHGVVADLTDAKSSSLPEAREEYDVAIISLALHHVEDATAVLRALAERLKPDGTLIVTDFLPFKHSDKGHGHNMAHTIKQHGFTEQQMADLFSSVGLHHFGFKVIPERINLSKDIDPDKFRDLFIARGKRAVDSSAK